MSSLLAGYFLHCCLFYYHCTEKQNKIRMPRTLLLSAYCSERRHISIAWAWWSGRGLRVPKQPQIGFTESVNPLKFYAWQNVLYVEMRTFPVKRTTEDQQTQKLLASSHRDSQLGMSREQKSSVPQIHIDTCARMHTYTISLQVLLFGPI